MDAAKEEILRRIHAANQAAGKPESPYPVPRNYRRDTSLDTQTESGGLIEQFTDRLEDYGVTVHTATSATLKETLNEVLSAIEQNSTSRIIYAPGLDADLFGPQAAPDDPSGDPRELDAAAAVVTGSTVSCAQTGTICLESGPVCGRRALSLVPDVHVCLVEESTIVGTVPQMIDRLNPVTHPEATGSPVTMISGPSATSDIELERVNGVHGPRTLHVIIVGDTE